jgi:hypothetical protein
MLFILVMEVLNTLFEKADDWNLLQRLGAKLVPFRNADDLIMFASPTASDMSSGLSCNMAKCRLLPIR